LTLVAGLYLVFVFIVPELLVVYFRVPVYLAGQSLLILVCATLDIGAQFIQQMQLQPGGYRR
jgi:preprotein translocase subunit SecY